MCGSDGFWIFCSGSDAVWLLLLVRRTLALEIQLTKLLFKESKEFRV